MAAIVSKWGGGPKNGQRGPERAASRFLSRLVKTFTRLLKRQRYEVARHYMLRPGPVSLRSKQRKDGGR
jgi:hypothetical protein